MSTVVERGVTTYSEEVIAIIAGLAAIEVEGIAGMSGGVGGNIAKLLGKNNLTKGVKAEVGKSEAIIELFVVVDYGLRIPDVAFKVQEKVKNDLERMTGLKIPQVNVHIQGVISDKRKN